MKSTDVNQGVNTETQEVEAEKLGVDIPSLVDKFELHEMNSEIQQWSTNGDNGVVGNNNTYSITTNTEIIDKSPKSQYDRDNAIVEE